MEAQTEKDDQHGLSSAGPMLGAVSAVRHTRPESKIGYRLLRRIAFLCGFCLDYHITQAVYLRLDILCWAATLNPTFSDRARNTYAVVMTGETASMRILY